MAKSAQASVIYPSTTVSRISKEVCTSSCVLDFKGFESDEAGAEQASVKNIKLKTKDDNELLSFSEVTNRNSNVGLGLDRPSED